jgi:hypothetical protein
MMVLRYYSMLSCCIEARGTTVPMQGRCFRDTEQASGSCMYCVLSGHGELATRYEFAGAPSFWKELGRHISSRRWTTLRKRSLSGGVSAMTPVAVYGTDIASGQMQTCSRADWRVRTFGRRRLLSRNSDHLIQDHAGPLNPVRQRTSGERWSFLRTVCHLSSLAYTRCRTIVSPCPKFVSSLVQNDREFLEESKMWLFIYFGADRRHASRFQLGRTCIARVVQEMQIEAFGETEPNVEYDDVREDNQTGQERMHP